MTTVSVGSTPTAHAAEDLTGVTELRAGHYVFFDLVMAGIGVCRIEDIALSVVVTVIGHRPEYGWVVTDGGRMAMSRDRGTAVQVQDQGYGLVTDLDGNLVPDLVMTAASQEHGTLAVRDGTRLPDLPVGTRLHVLPNHACAPPPSTAATTSSTAPARPAPHRRSRASGSGSPAGDPQGNLPARTP